MTGFTRNRSQSGIGLIGLLVLVLLVSGVIAGVLYFRVLDEWQRDIQRAASDTELKLRFWKQRLETHKKAVLREMKTDIVQPAKPPVSAPDMTGWKTYRNEQYRFEVKYPSAWYKNFEFENDGFLQLANLPKCHAYRGACLSLGMSVVVTPNRVFCRNPSNGATWLDQVVYENNVVDREKIICPGNNLRIELSLNGNDPRVAEHERLLEKIASTFNFIK